MHDIDRTQLEMEWEADFDGPGEFEDEYEYDEYEFETYPELYEEVYDEYEFESPLTDAEEMELAADLLEITDDAELDYFLGKLFKKVSRKFKKIVPKSVRRQLGGMLKGAAKQLLPIAGRALGSVFGGPAGGAVGGQLAPQLGRMFGLELEGLSPEDQEFELARRYVRLAADAAKQATKAPPGSLPTAVAKSAVAAAAQKHAPGLAGSALAGVKGVRGRRGIWKRRGNAIVVFGVYR